MSDAHSIENDFLNKITKIIEENLSNEQFGVSELAREIGMSRSNLLRKIKKSTELSVSQFIRQVRLKHAMEMLKHTSLNVSEVSYQVGFSSTSYFIKCFREHYGYPPGEVGNKVSDEIAASQIDKPKKKRWIVILGVALSLCLIAAILFIIFKPIPSKPADLEKSIAVLPFKNDSNDSTNVHIINGLMESILANLQKIEDLRVVSRTSLEKYRNTSKTIPEIAQELNVNYFVEGSGQKMGDKILLNVQLIEAPTDNHLWAEQYSREATDIFKLQMDIAKNIADKIEVIITPEVAESINKAPTSNLVAYDYFLKGLDLFYQGTRESVEAAIPYFEQAIEHDDQFARAYADIAISYYYLDALQKEKEHTVQINNFADKALLLDAKLPQSLIAKALFYMNKGENDRALPYLEKALEYNPNSTLVINILSEYYTSYVPNTEKYLEYALRGIRLDIAANDSVSTSFIYLHISNAFIQSGFIAEAEKYINKSLEYDQNNLFSAYVKAYILYAKNRDLSQTKALLINALDKDSTRLDILQEVGKICYYGRDYESAYFYYQKFVAVKKALNLDIYSGEDVKIGVVFSEMGLNEEAEKFFNDYFEYATNDESIYKHLSLAMYYSRQGDTKKAIEQLELFSQQDNYHYWTIIFLEIDPLVDNIKDLPEFKKIFNVIESKFWDSHTRIKVSLEEKGLI